MKYRMIQRCRTAFPIRMMCRCLRVAPSGYYGWSTRVPSARAQENVRLLKRIRGLHADHDGVLGSPRIWEDLRYEGERGGRHRVARLMRQAGLQGVPQQRRWVKKSSGPRPRDTRKSSGTGLQRRRTQHQMGHRYYLHSHGRALVVPLCRAGFVLGPRGGLVDESATGTPVGLAGCADGVVAATRAHPRHSCTRIGAVNLPPRNTNGSWRPTR